MERPFSVIICRNPLLANEFKFVIKTLISVEMPSVIAYITAT
jgi:hypothetical protein